MRARNGRDELADVQATTDYLLQQLKDDWIIGHFANNRLSSVFQPVIAADSRQIIGHAAYIRCESDQEPVISPWGIFALATEDSLLVKLDRLCRTLHALNYFNAASRAGNLFVSVQPRLLESVKDDHGQAFAKILDLMQIPTSRVVIEIPAEVNRNWKLLRHVIGNYRSRGYRIAINHSVTTEDRMAELASLYPLYPHIVRLEASALQRCGGAESLVEAAHHFGASVLVHDIETAQQKTAVVESGADLLQGRALGLPRRAIETALPEITEERYPAPTRAYRQPSSKGAPD
ncbi:MAG TPA: EAL domain-containing protein [Nitrosospira sp.]|nr:EAL domain-containing protein [Nitrosospira sp.]